MRELLAPAGNLTAAYAAISQGANAIYIGLNTFSARAYAKNFTIDEVTELVKYCHLRKVALYVTINTIIFESELSDVFSLIDQLYQIGVDAIIVQDLAIIDYLKKYKNIMEAHASTQIGIDDLYGVTFLKKHGIARVVLAREVPIEKALSIKEQTNMPIELFIHGALCVSYSGNCLMSGLIGYRSGNRGRCVGSCRKPFTLLNVTTQSKYPTCYLLSMKDLNTTSYLKHLEKIDSLKIEGRMKDPTYVASITNIYRQLLDGNTSSTAEEINTQLSKTFQRTFTKGYLFGEDKKDIVNTLKPNNFGLLIGQVTNVHKQKITISLTTPVNQFDHIRIETTKGEVNFPLTKMYNNDGLLVNHADKSLCITLNDFVNIGSKVYLTKDTKYLKNWENAFSIPFQRFTIDMSFTVTNQQMTLTITDDDTSSTYTSPYIIPQALNKPTTKEDIANQLTKLGDTIYQIGKLQITIPSNIYIPVKELNDVRRQAIVQFNNQKTIVNRQPIATNTKPIVSTFPFTFTRLCASVKTKEQFDACLLAGLKPEDIYFTNIIRRNNADYQTNEEILLVGGYGSLEYFKDRTIISDYSFNVVNSETVRILHQANVHRITLSYELNKKQIDEIVSNYQQKYDGLPHLELIIYGRQPLMVTNFCPLRHYQNCGSCQKENFAIIDDHNASFPLFFDNSPHHTNCQTTIYNSKILNLLDEIPQIKNIAYFRLAFTDESPTTVKTIIKAASAKLANQSTEKLFNEATDTRGHFNKEIM